MITVKASVTDGASPALKKLIAALSGDESTALNEVAGRAAVLSATKYHRDFDKTGGWKGKRYLGPSDEGSSYGAQVASAWSLGEVTAKGVTIVNTAPFLAFKASGGTVTPKRGKYLTIPLIREAKGRRAADYEIRYNDLFTIKGKNALFERIGGKTTGSRGRRGQAGASTIKTTGIRAVYALVRKVTHKPWPGALPPDSRIAEAYAGGYRTALGRLIEEL